jgi:hypothetical protein
VDALYLAENLLWLLGGVPIVGSDHYGEDSLHEADSEDVVGGDTTSNIPA